MKSIAFLTYEKNPSLMPDDQLAADAVAGLGIEVESRVWDGTSFDALAQFDLLLLRSMWDYHEKFEKFSAWLSECERRQIRILNPPKLVRWNSSKRYLAELQSKHSIDIVPTFFLTPKDTVEETLRQLPWKELVIKPEISASANSTFRVRKAEIENFHDEIDQILARGTLLVQPFCESVVEGEYSLIYFADGTSWRFSHAVLKIPKPGDFRVQEEWGGSMISITAPEEMRRLADRTIATIPEPWLYARVDIVTFDGLPRVAELELIEPHLYFGCIDEAPARFARALKAFL